MKVIRCLALVFAVDSTQSLCNRAVRADDWDKATRITFSRSVQLPGTVLPPGTYVFKLLDAPPQHIVRVMDANQMQVLATVLAIPNSQLEPSEGTVLTTEERPSGQPEAIRAWFYPGDTIGEEFVYPKSQPAPLTAQLNTREASLTQPALAAPRGRATECGKPAATSAADNGAASPRSSIAAERARITRGRARGAVERFLRNRHEAFAEDGKPAPVDWVARDALDRNRTGFATRGPRLKAFGRHASGARISAPERVSVHLLRMRKT